MIESTRCFKLKIQISNAIKISKMLMPSDFCALGCNKCLKICARLEMRILFMSIDSSTIDRYKISSDEREIRWVMEIG